MNEKERNKAIEEAKKKDEEEEKKRKQKILEEVLRKNNLEFCDDNKSKLGKGGFGSVFKVRDRHNKKRTYAAKIIEGKVEENREKVKDFRGENIIKINKEIEIDKDDLYIIIMELSTMGDLRKLPYNNKNDKNNKNKISNFLDMEKAKKILKEPFLEEFGDNLMRFFTKQLISALKIFNQGNLVHFDIKPANILLFKNLEIKLIDFTFLKRLDNPEEKKEIPGGTPGYVSPEYYYDYTSLGPIDEVLKAQDYFAVGATIFFLKYGKEMLDYDKYPKKKEINDIKNNEELKKLRISLNISKEFTGDVITYNLENVAGFIRMQNFQDKDFTEFLCSLIQYKPTDRPDFEHIIRNKWVNKNLEEIEKIKKINSIDEKNLILELQKSDFLINKSRKYRKKFDEKNRIDDLKYINNKKGKFKFGRRK